MWDDVLAVASLDSTDVLYVGLTADVKSRFCNGHELRYQYMRVLFHGERLTAQRLEKLFIRKLREMHEVSHKLMNKSAGGEIPGSSRCLSFFIYVAYGSLMLVTVS